MTEIIIAAGIGALIGTIGAIVFLWFEDGRHGGVNDA